MNVEEYFPEGLSVIHPDESHREKRGNREELQTKFSPPIHCHVCYKNILGTVNNVDYIKPCNCPMMFVHTRCASRNKQKFGRAKCSNCGQGSTIPRFSKMYPCRKVGSTRERDEQVCVVCQIKDCDEKRGGKKTNIVKKLEPCFCGRVYHFSCFTPLLEEQSSCSECGVVYHSFQPASVRKFFKSNWRYYISYIFVLAFLSTVFTIALKNSVFMKSGEYDNKSKILTGTAAFFLVVILAGLICVLKYTWRSAIPKFRITHGKVILKPYKKGSTGKLPKKMLEILEEDEFEDIPLVDLQKPSVGEAEAEETHEIEDARGYETEDMTLGQHMFGVYATHHSSSTPIDRPPLGFVFDA